jgi:predicted DNA binding protein
MFEAQLHLQQEKSCILSQLAHEYGPEFDIHIQELHDEKVTFLLAPGEDVNKYYTRLEGAEHVDYVERLDDGTIAITKPSCGAYAAVYENNAIMRRRNHISASERVYNILFFDRSDLQNIITRFREIGEVTLSSLTEVGEESPRLTGRQREVIQAALDAGYFEWPREITSDELAEQLDVTRATCLEHLRKAEAKLIKDALADDAVQEDVQASSSKLPT